MLEISESREYGERAERGVKKPSWEDTALLRLGQVSDL